jgi:hypothetical protein
MDLLLARHHCGANGTYTFTTPQSTSAGPAFCNGIENPTSLDVYAPTQELRRRV